MIKYLTVAILALLTLFTRAQDEYLVESFKEHSEKVNTVAFSKSGKYLVSGGEDKLLVIRGLKEPGSDRIFPDNYFPPKDIEFYGDLQLFITAGRDIKLIDLQNKQLALYKGSATHIWSLDFAPERNKLTAGSYDKTLHVWNAQTEEVEFELEGHEKSALTVAFSGDEKYLVSASRDLSVKIWSAKTGELLNSIEQRHSDNIFDVEFHPNTKYFATASADKTIRLWDIEKGAVIKTYAGHDKTVVDIEFSPDGYFMYSASVDGVVYVWEVATGKKVHSYVKHEGGVNAIAVSSDGHFVASAGNDGIVYLWRSAKGILVDLYSSDKLQVHKQEYDTFLPKQKGESRDEYKARVLKSRYIESDLIEQLYQEYLNSSGIKQLPLE